MPTVAEVAQLIVALATLVSAAATWRTARSTRTVAKRTHDLVNGQSEELRQVRQDLGHRLGLAEGIALERDRPPS